MKMAWIVLAAGAAIVAAMALVTAGGEAGGSATRENRRAEATLRTAAGEEIGEVKLRQRGDVVEMKLEVEGSVTPGFHGFHVHTTGVCVSPFTTAGGHYNPAGAVHSDHAGDLPSLFIDADGEAEAEFATDRFALGALFDADGAAFILHAGRDNYANIPTDRYEPDPDTATLATGDAGGRFACGVIERR